MLCTKAEGETLRLLSIWVRTGGFRRGSSENKKKNDKKNNRDTAVVFEYTLLAVVVAAVVVSFYYTAVTGISPIPSSSTSRRKVLECLPKDLEGRILELGAGWGTLAFPLAYQFPECEVLALELSPVPWFFMYLRSRLFRRRNLRIRRMNFLRYPFEGAKAVVCYLHEEALATTRLKMENELEPGTLIISNTFAVPGWTPETVHRLDDSFCPNVYIYRVPEKAAVS